MAKYTDKKLLAKGIKFLAIALPLLILSPYLLTLTFLNKSHDLYYFGFAIGLIVGVAAILFVFKGLKTLIKALFG